MKKKKLLGWAIILAALVLLIAGDSVPSIMSLFITLGAMLLGVVGLYLAFDEASDKH